MTENQMADYDSKGIHFVDSEFKGIAYAISDKGFAVCKREGKNDYKTIFTADIEPMRDMCKEIIEIIDVMR